MVFNRSILRTEQSSLLFCQAACFLRWRITMLPGWVLCFSFHVEISCFKTWFQISRDSVCWLPSDNDLLLHEYLFWACHGALCCVRAESLIFALRTDGQWQRAILPASADAVTIGRYFVECWRILPSLFLILMCFLSCGDHPNNLGKSLVMHSLSGFRGYPNLLSISGTTSLESPHVLPFCSLKKRHSWVTRTFQSSKSAAQSLELQLFDIGWSSNHFVWGNIQGIQMYTVYIYIHYCTWSMDSGSKMKFFPILVT